MAAPVPLHFIINVNKTHVHTWIRLYECVLIIMSCFGDDSIKVSNMAAPIKSGYMLRYKRRIFGKDWREQYVTLFSDSSLIWYKDRNSNEHEGGIRIRDAPELMAFGEFTSNVPNRPELPSGYTPTTLIVFGTRGRETIYWFLCKYELEIQEWIAAIVGTLPPPPQPPQPPTNPSAPTEQEQMQGTNVNPVPPPAMPNTMQPPYQRKKLPALRHDHSTISYPENVQLESTASQTEKKTPDDKTKVISNVAKGVVIGGILATAVNQTLSPDHHLKQLDRVSNRSSNEHHTSRENSCSIVERQNNFNTYIEKYHEKSEDKSHTFGGGSYLATEALVDLTVTEDTMATADVSGAMLEEQIVADFNAAGTDFYDTVMFDTGDFMGDNFNF